MILTIIISWSFYDLKTLSNEEITKIKKNIKNKRKKRQIVRKTIDNEKKMNNKEKKIIREKNKILNSSNSKFEITRFKGLGEMMPAQLKETTMSPENRILLKVEINKLDKKKTAKSVDALMGKKPELRFKFIQDNSQKISASEII